MLVMGISQDGLTIDIEDAISGKKSNLKCPCCGDLLIAKKGKIKSHHFAHQSIECKYWAETQAHIFAKKYIEDNMELMIPYPYLEDHSDGRKSLEYHFKKVKVDSVILEKKLSNIVPDIICEIKGSKFIIEIAVTHFSDNIKIEKIKQLGIPAIEIDFSDLNKNVSFKYQIEAAFNNGKYYFNYLYNIKVFKMKDYVNDYNKVVFKINEQKYKEQERKRNEEFTQNLRLGERKAFEEIIKFGTSIFDNEGLTECGVKKYGMVDKYMCYDCQENAIGNKLYMGDEYIICTEKTNYSQKEIKDTFFFIERYQSNLIYLLVDKIKSLNEINKFNELLDSESQNITYKRVFDLIHGDKE